MTAMNHIGQLFNFLNPPMDASGHTFYFSVLQWFNLGHTRAHPYTGLISPVPLLPHRQWLLTRWAGEDPWPFQVASILSSERLEGDLRIFVIMYIVGRPLHFVKVLFFICNGLRQLCHWVCLHRLSGESDWQTSRQARPVCYRLENKLLLIINITCSVSINWWWLVRWWRGRYDFVMY